MNTILREMTYPSGTALSLIQGDITLAAVDAVVNPANQFLQHGGGLAGVLSKKAGPALQSESNLWVRENGPVSHERPAHTSAGDLPFKAVIHAVGPVWGSGNEESKLRAAVQGSLRTAASLELNSLAIPAISTGIFGYPLDQAANVILKAIDEFICQEISSVHQVQVVLFDKIAAEAFSTAWDQTLS